MPTVIDSTREVARELRRLLLDEVLAAARRKVGAKLGRGHYARPLDLERDRVALLFFEDFERDRFVKNDRRVRRALRRLYHASRRSQRVTGFEVAFLVLVEALRRAGWTVLVGDREAALENPRYPVCISGYPHVLDRWDLPNPAVLGPGLLDHPALAPELMKDPRFATYFVGCEWMRSLFEQAWGPGTCTLWFGGIDLDAWPASPASAKDTDFVLYDKLPAARHEMHDRVVAELDRRGLTHTLIRYRHYDHAGYRVALARSRGLIWLSEHETQGFAYQEAMSADLPILAFDPGVWHDPNAAKHGVGPVPVSSVPWFDASCGERFADAAGLPAALDRFLARRGEYAPRRYIEEHLSLAKSAEAFLAAYRAAASR